MDAGLRRHDEWDGPAAACHGPPVAPPASLHAAPALRFGLPRAHPTGRRRAQTVIYTHWAVTPMLAVTYTTVTPAQADPRKCGHTRRHPGAGRGPRQGPHRATPGYFST